MENDARSVPIQDLLEAKALLIGDGYRAKNDELSRGGLPFARAQNIDGGFKFVDADCFPTEALSKVGNKISQPGDVVFTSKGTVGRFAFVRHNTPQFVYSPQLCFWRSLDHDRIVPRWLFYWMQGPEFYEQYKGVAGQTDMADYVNLRDQRRMSISLPASDDQRAIAHVLGTLDDAIELNHKMTETVEAIATALFRSWFVDFDPVRAKASGESPAAICRRLSLSDDVLRLFPDSFDDFPFDDRPRGWSTTPLYRRARFVNGKAFDSEEFSKTRLGYPIIKIAEIKNGLTAQTQFTEGTFEEKHKIRDGDLLFSWSGSPGTSIDTFVWSQGIGWLNQHIFRVDTDSREQRTFVYCLLRFLKPQFVAIAKDKQTTGLGHVTVEDLKRIPTVEPDPALILKFHQIVGPLLDRSLQNQVECRALACLRDTLLPRLLSGELLVPLGGKHG